MSRKGLVVALIAATLFLATPGAAVVGDLGPNDVWKQTDGFRADSPVDSAASGVAGEAGDQVADATETVERTLEDAGKATAEVAIAQVVLTADAADVDADADDRRRSVAPYVCSAAKDDPRESSACGETARDVAVPADGAAIRVTLANLQAQPTPRTVVVTLLEDGRAVQERTVVMDVEATTYRTSAYVGDCGCYVPNGAQVVVGQDWFHVDLGQASAGHSYEVVAVSAPLADAGQAVADAGAAETTDRTGSFGVQHAEASAAGSGAPALDLGAAAAAENLAVMAALGAVGAAGALLWVRRRRR